MDDIKVTGLLSIYRVDGASRSLVFEDKNLITDVGLSFLPWVLANDLSTLPGVARSNDLAVQRMEIGTDAAAIPSVTDQLGVVKLIYAPTLEVNNEGGTPAAMSFGGFIPPEAGNDPVTPGNTNWYLYEEALILGNGYAFAKKAFAVKKNNTHGLYFRHRIQFQRA